MWRICYTCKKNLSKNIFQSNRLSSLTKVNNRTGKREPGGIVNKHHHLIADKYIKTTRMKTLHHTR
jgi:hypothetical protein